MAEERKSVIIVGGGFGGVRCALDLAKSNESNLKITLISDKPHFEYHAALYRVVTGRSPLEVCVPLSEVFAHTPVEVVEDRITTFDLKKKEVTGKTGKVYRGEFLVLALGSETTYFDIPGLEKLSYGFKSIQEALRLKRHIHQSFEVTKALPKDTQIQNLHFIVVGGGASGVELSGELSIYLKKLMKSHELDPSMLTIDLIESAPRLLTGLTPDVSRRALVRLQSLGVNVFLNRTVVKEEIEKLYMKDMTVNTKTVIWTAGIKPNSLYSKIEGLTFDKKGRVYVDHYLQPDGFKDVFVLGDAAATQYSGMAQTALRDGSFAAIAVMRKLRRQRRSLYRPVEPAYAIPIGPGWALVILGGWHFTGSIGWFLRRFVDFKFFNSILPPSKAWLAFKSGRTLCETCNICSIDDKPAVDKVKVSA